MAERNSRGSNWRHGWPAIVAVGLVVVAAGFAIGVVAGITWEEPKLVVGYLGGQTEGIDWGGEAAPEADRPEPSDLAADGEIPAPPSVAAPPPLGMRKASEPAVSEREKSGSETDAAAPRAAAPPREPAPPREAAPTSTRAAGGFAVQVGAFSEKHSAQTLADALRARGYPVYLSPTEGDRVSWRVRVGPMGTRPEAEKAARRLEAAEKLPTWVLGEDS